MTPQIVEPDGSIFDSGCAALVNPVDAMTGAQGKGLALEFKRRWPESAAEYRRHAQSGRMHPGGLFIDARNGLFILYTATKRHWRNPSSVVWVKRALEEIVVWLSTVEIESIAIPALGCGLGSLSWRDVRPLILDAAKWMQCARVVIYGPK